LISLAKRTAIDALSAAGWWSGRTQPVHCHAAQLVIVTFHRVLPELEREQYPYPGLSVTPTELSFCLGYFAQHYEIDLLSRQYARLQAKEPSRKPRLAITFDDGQWDNFAHAEPVLRTHELCATFYIPTDAVDQAQLIWHDRLGYAAQEAIKSERMSAAFRELYTQFGLVLAALSPSHAVEVAKQLSPAARGKLVIDAVRLVASQPPRWGRLMDWSEIRSLHERGHEIGSHSVSHELMPQLDDVEIAHESATSKAKIESAIEAEVQSYCYPNGSSDARCEAAVARAGYRNAVTTRWGANTGDDSPYALRRCDVDARALRDATGQLSRQRLAFRLSGHYPGLGG
jgi:peptidoglycan/xylan/chitin deacetylase (PgdA/CDA1 family)